MNTHARPAVAVVLIGLLLLPPAVDAQQDKNAERQARRMQLQMQSLQEQLSAAQSAKLKVDGEKAEVDKRLQSESVSGARIRGALRQTEQARKTLEAERNELKTRLAAIETQMIEHRQSSADTLARREQASKLALEARDAAQARIQAGLDQQASLLAECSIKNERLVKLGAELLGRWRSKGLSDVFAQKESLLGLGDVQMFNLVQDYRDRTDAERFRPPVGR